jgi:hypothetical protein
VAVEYRDQASRAMVAQRIEDNRALPGSEIALHRIIFAQQGSAAHSGMSESILLAWWDRHLPKAWSMLAAVGPLRELKFKGVDSIGWDIYDGHFAKGDLELRTFVTPDGKMHGLTIVGAAANCQSSEPYECRGKGTVNE